MARTVLEVFLSSTAADLKSYRDAVYARLVRIEFFKCIRQEDFGAQNAEAMQYCCDRAKAADLFVGMIGYRRGWEPHGDNAKRSITEMEYDSARDAGRARYLWVSPDDFPVPGNLRESDAEHERQLAFRKRVMGGGERIVSQKGFASPDALASEIVEQLLAHIVTGDLITLLRPEFGQAGIARVEDQKPAIAAAVEKLAEDKDVDLLALAKNPHGVDISQLEAKLTARAELHEAAGQKENKTSAEYWCHIGALAFLHNSQKALAAYKNAASLDPENADALRFLGELQYRLGELPAARNTFLALVRLGQCNSNKHAETMGLMRLGWIHQRRGELTEADSVATKALRLAEAAGWKEGIARAHGNLANNHFTRGNIDEAERMDRKSLQLYAELGNRPGMAISYSNLGAIHAKRGELKKAEQMYRKSLTVNEELGNKEGMATDYGNLGDIHADRGEFDEAERMYRKSLALNEELGRKEGMAAAYSNLGNIHEDRGEFDKAEQSYRTSLVLDEELGDREGSAIVLWNLALISEKNGNKQQLCECLRRARDFWKEMGLQTDVAEAEAWMKRARCPKN